MQRARLLLGLALVPLLAGSAAALVTATPNPKRLPIGKAVSTTGAARGVVYACSLIGGGGGAFATGAWIHADGTYDITAKPSVDGDVGWPNAVVTFSPGSGGLVVKGNGLPKGTHTGTFPVSAGSNAYQYDRNPNSIANQVVDWKLPVPAVAPKPSCLMGGPIGVALNGVAIFDALDAQNRDAVAYEILDRCQGHPERSGRYHYHSIPACLTKGESAKRHSALVGYALDGFPITGRRGDGGKLLSNADLDACHGHAGTLVVNGKRVRTYHYHSTLEYPYTLGCFRGTPLRLLTAKPITPEPPPQPQG